MRNVGRVLFCALATIALAAPAWSLPAATHGAAARQTAPQEQSVSGKIISVEKNSFTLTVGQSHTSTGSRDVEQDAASPKTMNFTTDKNTTIEGTLKVGANADVTYRQEKGTNLAISVRVTP